MDSRGTGRVEGSPDADVRHALGTMAKEVTDVLGIAATTMATHDGSVVSKILARDADIQWWGAMVHDMCARRTGRTDVAEQELRQLSAILRLATGLEHVAELAESITGRARDLHQLAPTSVDPELLQAVEVARAAVRRTTEVVTNPAGGAERGLAQLSHELRLPPRIAPEVPTAGAEDPRQLRRAVRMQALVQDVELLLEAALDLPLLAAESVSRESTRRNGDQAGPR
ncbi:MAG: hypothetical protein JXB32_17130 [Deltaproteobacteria bacterium]|nr:hypothetical protein [Deltaproteobacteria bacterium]